jgi:hypothetical protein
VISSYGFLTYNNRPPPALPGCCSPRWSGPPFTGCPGYAYGHNRNMLRAGYLGDDLLPAAAAAAFAPADMAISVGNMAKYMLVLPSARMVVVSMGSSWGSSAACDVNIFPNYDEALTGTTLWQALRPALLPQGGATGATPGPAGRAGETRATEAGVVGELGEGEGQPEHRAALAGLPALTQSVAAKGGACYCYCPPDTAEGSCFAVGPNDPAARAGGCLRAAPLSDCRFGTQSLRTW